MTLFEQGGLVLPDSTCYYQYKTFQTFFRAGEEDQGPTANRLLLLPVLFPHWFIESRSAGSTTAFAKLTQKMSIFLFCRFSASPANLLVELRPIPVPCSSPAFPTSLSDGYLFFAFHWFHFYACPSASPHQNQFLQSLAENYSLCTSCRLHPPYHSSPVNPTPIATLLTLVSQSNREPSQPARSFLFFALPRRVVSAYSAGVT